MTGGGIASRLRRNADDEEAKTSMTDGYHRRLGRG